MRNMMSFIVIIIFVVLFLFLGNTEVSFSPFKVIIHEWWKPVGLLL